MQTERGSNEIELACGVDIGHRGLPCHNILLPMIGNQGSAAPKEVFTEFVTQVQIPNRNAGLQYTRASITVLSEAIQMECQILYMLYSPLSKKN